MTLILFVDMDSFYASCELLRHPELQKKAFIVGTGDVANKHKGVVEAANYLAKKFGIRSAMPTSTAMKIKPDISYVPADHEYYEQMSKKVMDTIASHGKRMEAMSVDEAAVDLDDMGYEGAEKFATELKKDINTKLGLPCTVGVTVGKVLAKMVCDSAKPDGLKVIREEKLRDFLKGKPVISIPGIGPKTEKRLEEFNIRTIDDLAKSTPQFLADKIGSFGPELYHIANGKDESGVVSEWKIQSISRERTLDTKTSDLRDVNKMLDMLAEEVISDVRTRGLSFKNISVKAKYDDFTDKLKGRSLNNYTDSLDVLKETARTLMKELASEKKFRKVGVRVASFTEGKGQKKLF